MSGFLQEEALRQQRLEQMAREDQQVIQRFNHSPAPFQRDKKKSLARQYRDYLIYRHLDHPEEETYGPRQEAAGYIQFQISQSRAAHQGQDPTLEGSTLKTGHCLLHLAASQLLAKEVGNDTLTRLADCLTAGSAWSAEDQQDPSQAYYQTLHQEGNALLKEIYFRHLEVMDRQYGEKLCSMTPAAYLEALPQIEADFACIEDMQIYFQQVAPLSEEEALMGQKLDFYVQVWARLKERTQILSDMQGEHVTQKGTLSGQYDAAYRREMQALRSAARRDKRLRPRKDRPSLPQTTSLDQVRSQALAALAQQQMIEQEEQQKDDAIAQQFEQLTGQQARLQAYLTACAILKQDNASPDAVQMAQATLQRFPGYTEARAEQEIADLAGPINALSEQRGQGQEAPIDSPELLLERCAQTTQIMQELGLQPVPGDPQPPHLPCRRGGPGGRQGRG